MTFDEFSAAIQGVVTRVEDLRGLVDDTPSARLLEQALEALGGSVEELQIAREELETRGRILAAAQSDIDAEVLRYRELFEIAPVAYVATDADGIVTAANAAAAALLGAAERALEGKPLAVFAEGDDRSVVVEAVAALRTGSATRGLDVRMHTLRRDRQFLVHLHAERQGSGDASVLWTMRDLEEREPASAAASEQLSGEHRWRDALVAELAAELRNPLAPVLVTIDTLARYGDRMDDQRRAAAAQLIIRNLRRVSCLIGEILDASRAARGKLVLDIEDVDLSALARQLLAASGRRLDGEREPVPVRADEQQLRRALSLLLEQLPCDAAMLRRDAGGAVLELRVDPERLAGAFAAARPALSQPGAAAERLRFTLARLLIERHGGRLSGNVQAGMLTIHLPIAGANGVASATRRLRILIVDDDPDVAEMLALALESRGYEVRVAFDGRSGHQASSAFAPDAVLLDLAMPGMSGIGLAEQLQSGPQPPLLISVTGYDSERARERAREAGIHHYLRKPVDLERVEALIARREQ